MKQSVTSKNSSHPTTVGENDGWHKDALLTSGDAGSAFAKKEHFLKIEKDAE